MDHVDSFDTEIQLIEWLWNLGLNKHSASWVGRPMGHFWDTRYTEHFFHIALMASLSSAVFAAWALPFCFRQKSHRGWQKCSIFLRRGSKDRAVVSRQLGSIRQLTFRNRLAMVHVWQSESVSKILRLNWKWKKKQWKNKPWSKDVIIFPNSRTLDFMFFVKKSLWFQNSKLLNPALFILFGKSITWTGKDLAERPPSTVADLSGRSPCAPCVLWAQVPPLHWPRQRPLGRSPCRLNWKNNKCLS